MKKSESIITYSGLRVWPTAMKPSDINPLDIAMHLGNFARYNGATKFHYSVAQHSCYMYDEGKRRRFELLVQKELLIHDGPEAYCGDMVAPLKHQLGMSFYREVEGSIHNAMCKRFNLPVVFDPLVHELDMEIRQTEIRDLKYGKSSARKGTPYTSLFPPIKKWSPEKAQTEMLTRLKEAGFE